MDTLDFARDIWKEFGLNNSQGAGVTFLCNGVITKQHGKATNTIDLKEMGETIVHYKRVKKSLKVKK